MLRFLFWNLNRKPLEPLVQQIVAAHDIDFVVLAEMHTTPFTMAAALNLKSSRRPFHHTPPVAYEKVARFDPSMVRPVYDTGRMTVRHFVLPGRDSFVVAGVHLGSKMHLRDDQQAARCVELSLQLAEQETKVGHTRTILVGDFNVNPFEHGVAGAPGFNAVMTRAIAGRGSRTVDSKERPFFYNPMWSHFGDSGPNPPGTYYYEGSAHMWNMFDQVLVRPALLDRFVEADLQVLTAIGDLTLLNSRGNPNARAASDHLPLLFALDIQETIKLMPENDIDLWPSDLGLEALPRSPVAILRQQAAALSAKLDNRIQARIYSAPIGFRAAKLRHRMVLVVPSLEDYELDLLNLSHGDNVYPVSAQLKDQEVYELGGEKELLEWLRVSFASEITRRALGSLLSLA